MDQSEEINKFQNLVIINPEDNSNKKSEKSQEESQSKKKKGCHFPTAYTILLVIEIVVFILLFIIPKGKFDTLEYSEDGKFIIKSLNKPPNLTEAKKEVLYEYKIKIPIENFINGYIKKPISIPGTYQRLENETTGFFKLFTFPIFGLIQSANISFLLFIIGGVINILVEMNALSAGMTALSQIMKGKEFLLIVLVFVIISICGTTFGMAEEIFAFYPILMPIFLKSGLDGMISMASLYMGYIIGNMFSTINAFTVVLGSYSAGINFIDEIIFRVIAFVIGDLITILYLFYYYRRVKFDEKKSITYDIKKDLEDKFLKEDINDEEKNNDNEENPLLQKKNENKDEFLCKQKIALIIFAAGFVIMVVGVIVLDWWFEEMTAVFLCIAIILIFLSGKGEEEGIRSFMRGGGDFFGVAIIIGIGRGINITLDEGKISDTILNFLSGAVSNLPKVIFAIIMLIIYMLIGFFIQSATGLAVLSLPVLAPLADNVGCPRAVVVNAYMFGKCLVGFITPTGLCLIALQIVNIKFNYWFKFIFPFMAIIFLYLLILIMINSMFF